MIDSSLPDQSAGKSNRQPNDKENHREEQRPRTEYPEGKQNGEEKSLNGNIGKLL